MTPVITATTIQILLVLWFTCGVILGLLLGFFIKVGQTREIES